MGRITGPGSASGEGATGGDTTSAPQGQPWWRLRKGCLVALLVAVVVPVSMCAASIAVFWATSSSKRAAIREAHSALRPGTPLRAALSTLARLHETVFVRVSQETSAGAAPLAWIAKRETLEAFASAVQPGRPLRVEIATTGSRQWLTIELDGAGAISSVSPLGGRAD